MRLATRRVRVHRGVFQTQPGRDDFWTTALAGHLACGPDAACSHDTAAYCWGLISSPPRRVELLVPADHAVRAPTGCVVRRLRRLKEQADPLRWPWVTTVDETVLDRAESGTDRMFAVLGRAFQRELTDGVSLLRRLDSRTKQRDHGLAHSAGVLAGSHRRCLRAGGRDDRRAPKPRLAGSPPSASPSRLPGRNGTRLMMPVVLTPLRGDIPPCRGGRKGQPPMLDMGRSGWRNPGSPMPWPRRLTHISPWTSPASSASVAPSRSGPRRSVSPVENRQLRT